MNDTDRNIDFLVPTTTNHTDWEVAEDTHLYKIFSLVQSMKDKSLINLDLK